MGAFLIILSGIAFVAICLILIEYLVDRGMTKTDRDVKRLRKSSFNEMYNLFINEKWEFDSFYPSSLFSKNAYYHAGIIRFNDVGYLVGIITWFRLILLQRKIRRTLHGYSEYKKPYIN